MGRHPSSDRCHTCRKRRVKCDGVKPTCGQCTRSGHSCRGYEPALRMRHWGQQQQQQHEVQQQQQQQIRQKVLHHHHQQQQQDVVVTEVEVEEEQQKPIKVSTKCPDPMDALIAGPYFGLEEAMVHSFFINAYRWGPFWYPVLRAAEDVSSPLLGKNCNKAVVYGYMGQKLGAQKLRNLAQGLYADSLRGVYSLIQRSSKMEMARAVPIILMLSIYNFSVEGGSGKVHVEGLNQLMQYCGPECFQQEDLFVVFRSCRMLHSCWGVTIRRRSFLEDHEWKTVPWKNMPKTMEDKLVDILLDIPGLLEDMDRYGDAAARRAIDMRIYQLHEWRLEWHSINKDAVEQAKASHLALDSDLFGRTPTLDEIMGLPLQMGTVEQALEIFYYDAALVCLLKPRNRGLTPLPRLSEASTKDVAYICRAAREPLLPGRIKFLCQPAIEAFRICLYLHKGLADASTAQKRMSLIPPGPFALIYWTLVDEAGLKSSIGPILPQFAPFRENETVGVACKINPDNKRIRGG